MQAIAISAILQHDRVSSFQGEPRLTIIKENVVVYLTFFTLPGGAMNSSQRRWRIAARGFLLVAAVFNMANNCSGWGEFSSPQLLDCSETSPDGNLAATDF